MRRDKLRMAHVGDLPVSEKVEQQHTVQTLEALGAKVYVLGTRRSRGKRCPKCATFVPEDQGTHQTSGISDLIVFMPAKPSLGILRRRVVFIEQKSSTGALRPAQQELQALCGEADVAHVHGTYNAVLAWLIAEGYLKAWQVPHYRQPAPEARP